MKYMIVIIALCSLSLNVHGQSVQNNSKQNAGDKNGLIFVTSPSANAPQAIELSGQRSVHVTQQASAVAIPAVSLNDIPGQTPANRATAPVKEQDQAVPKKIK